MNLQFTEMHPAAAAGIRAAKEGKEWGPYATRVFARKNNAWRPWLLAMLLEAGWL